MLNNKKENKRLPMPGKVKKGFRCYCTLVMAAALLGCCSMTAFAADDPLEVVNNLSEFTFWFDPGGGPDPAGLGHRSGGPLPPEP